MTLPDDVLQLVEMSPVEDLLLVLLRDRLSTVPVQTRIEDDQTFPFVLIRSAGSWGTWAGDERFLDASHVFVHCYAQGLNREEDANNLAEAIRVILRDSRNIVIPHRGHIVEARMMSRPRPVSDWATSAGPVQYADLPTDVARFETEYNIVIRKPNQKPFGP